MSLKISHHKDGMIEVKRFYLDFLNIEQTCPKCGWVQDYDQYLSYPKINKSFDLDMYCSECEHEWKEKIELSVKLLSK